MPSAYTVIAPAPEPAIPNGHIGDLGCKLLRDILFNRALHNDPVSVVNFAYASPYLMHKIGADDVLEFCGIRFGANSQQECLWWAKKNALNRAQKKNWD